MSHKELSLQEAIRCGANAYTSTTACKNGHIGLRTVKNRKCIQCAKDNLKKEQERAANRGDKARTRNTPTSEFLRLKQEHKHTWKVAEIIGCKPGTVSRRIKKARLDCCVDSESRSAFILGHVREVLANGRIMDVQSVTQALKARGVDTSVTAIYTFFRKWRKEHGSKFIRIGEYKQGSKKKTKMYTLGPAPDEPLINTSSASRSRLYRLKKKQRLTLPVANDRIWDGLIAA